MKVSNIEQAVGVDGPIWVISFEEKKLTLTEKEKPSYSIGDEIPFDLEVVKPEKGKWYYVRKGDKADKKFQGGKRSYGKSPEELELSTKSFALSYAKDLAVGKVISLAEVIVVADDFLDWLKGKGEPPISPGEIKLTTAPRKPSEAKVEPQKADSLIDMDWLKESLKTLQSDPDTAKGWSNANVILYLNSMTQADAKTVTKAIEALDKKQAEDFVKQVERVLGNR